MAYDIAGDIRLDPRLKAILAGHGRRRRRATSTVARRCWPRRTRRGARSRRSCSAASWICATPRTAAPSAGLAGPHREGRLRAGRQQDQPPGHPARQRRDGRLRLLHPRRRHGVTVVLRRHVPRLGQDHRRERRRRRHGRLPQLGRRASSVPEVAPFPAGLNDCVSGLKWVVANAGQLGIDPARIIVAGESGGGNLTLATGLKLKQDGELGLIKGLYALCPYIARRVADAGVPVLDREQRHPPRPAQQPRRDRLRDRGVRPSATRWPGRRSRPTRTSRASRRP